MPTHAEPLHFFRGEMEVVKGRPVIAGEKLPRTLGKRMPVSAGFLSWRTGANRTSTT
jgi:hypothetical protein